MQLYIKDHVTLFTIYIQENKAHIITNMNFSKFNKCLHLNSVCASVLWPKYRASHMQSIS